MTYCEHGCWHGNGCNRCAQSAAFWSGFTHPFSKPYLWWSRERCVAWLMEHGRPWEAS